jgi:hypothetical protein
MALDRDALKHLGAVSDMDVVHVVHHYLYFPREEAAKNVAGILRERGFVVEERLGADGINWLVLATHRMVPTEAGIAKMREFLEHIAEESAGEYDGWEIDVQSRQNRTS